MNNIQVVEAEQWEYDSIIKYMDNVYKKYHIFPQNVKSLWDKYHKYNNIKFYKASFGLEIIGAIAVIEDGPEGVPSDEIFKDKLDKLRNKGKKFYEISGISTTRGNFETVVRMFLKAALDSNSPIMVGSVSPKHGAFYMHYSIGGFDKEVREHPFIPGALAILGSMPNKALILFIRLYLLKLFIYRKRFIDKQCKPKYIS